MRSNVVSASRRLRRLIVLRGAQSPGQRLEQVPGDGCVLLHERSELPVGEPVADELGARGDRGRTRALVDEGDLAEVVAFGQRRARPAADRDRRFARLDDEEGRAPGTLLGDRLARGEATLLEERRDAFDVAGTHVGEERYALDHFDPA